MDKQKLNAHEAAELLNVSHDSFIKLIEKGEISCHLIDSQYFITFADLMTYKKYQDEKRRTRLAEFTQLLQEEGFYD